MTNYSSSFLISLALTSFLFTGLPCSIQAMEGEVNEETPSTSCLKPYLNWEEGDWDQALIGIEHYITATSPHFIKTREKKEGEMPGINNTFNEGFIRIASHEYGAAFDYFLKVAFQKKYTVNDFNTAGGKYDEILSYFTNYHQQPAEEDELRFASFAFVYSLWQMPWGLGLSSTSTLGNAMIECIKKNPKFEKLNDFKARNDLLSNPHEWIKWMETSKDQMSEKTGF